MKKYSHCQAWLDGINKRILPYRVHRKYKTRFASKTCKVCLCEILKFHIKPNSNTYCDFHRAIFYTPIREDLKIKYKYPVDIIV